MEKGARDFTNSLMSISGVLLRNSHPQLISSWSTCTDGNIRIRRLTSAASRSLEVHVLCSVLRSRDERLTSPRRQVPTRSRSSRRSRSRQSRSRSRSKRIEQLVLRPHGLEKRRNRLSFQRNDINSYKRLVNTVMTYSHLGLLKSINTVQSHYRVNRSKLNVASKQNMFVAVTREQSSKWIDRVAQHCNRIACFRKVRQEVCLHMPTKGA